MGKFLEWMDNHSGKVILVLVMLVVISCIGAVVSGDAGIKWNESITTMTKGEFFCSLVLVGLLTRGK